MMKQINLIVRFLLSLLLIVSLAGCAGSKRYESTGEYIDDSVLTTKVKASILGDSKLKVLQIDVETFKGIVQLSGFVDTPEAAERAVQLARTVKGVKQVNNSLIVK
ncbi:BON domain-containing protein [Methylosarcina fibrata]